MRGNTQGLTPGLRAAFRSQLLVREVSERRQVGDAEDMVNADSASVELAEELQGI